MEKIKGLLKKLITKYRTADIVFKASIWFICVTIVNNSISLLTQPIINRILTVEEVGVYSVYNTWHSIFAIVATFNLYCGVLEVLITKEKEKSNRIVASLCTLSLIISIAFFGICCIFIKPLSNWLLLKPIYILAMGATVIAEAIIQFWCVEKRFLYLYKHYSILMIVLFVVKSILTVVLAYALKADHVLGRILGLCLPSVLVAIVLLALIFKKADWKKITSYWKKAVVFNFPLIPHYLSSILLASSDKIMIQRLAGNAEAGLYAVAYTFAGLALIVFTAINNAYTPFSMTAIREKKYKTLSEKTNMIVLFSVFFSLGLTLLAPEGLYILGGKEYLKSLDIVPILILGIFFSSFYFIFSNVEFVYECNKFIFPITLLGAGLNILLNWLFIPRWGYQVAAYTTLISYIIIAICHYIASIKISKEKIYEMKEIILYLIILLSISLLSLWLYRINQFIRYTCCLLVIALFVLICMMKRKKNLKPQK